MSLQTITDLLDTSKTNLKIKENHDGDVYVGDLTETPVGSPEYVSSPNHERQTWCTEFPYICVGDDF